MRSTGSCKGDGRARAFALEEMTIPFRRLSGTRRSEAQHDPSVHASGAERARRLCEALGLLNFGQPVRNAEAATG